MKKLLERRIVSAAPEIRENADGTVGVRGYFAVWDSVEHGEVIRRGAFDRTIAQRDDIRLLVNHDGVPLARTKSGTLTLGTDDHGGWFDAPSLDRSNPTVQELVSAMSRGDIDQCSFAGYFSDRTVDGVREVFEVKGVDVSVVTLPWYSETSAGLTGGDRAMADALLCLRSLTPTQRESVLAGDPAAHRAAVLGRLELRTAPAGGVSWSDIWRNVERALDEQTGSWCFIVDMGDGWVVYERYGAAELVMASWSLTDGVVTVDGGNPVVPTYVPATDPGAAATVTTEPAEAARTYSIAEARALLAPA